MSGCFKKRITLLNVQFVFIECMQCSIGDLTLSPHLKLFKIVIFGDKNIYLYSDVLEETMGKAARKKLTHALM